MLYQDDEILAIDKPSGLAVQGGSKTNLHIDGALDGLKLGAKDRPRLVHQSPIVLCGDMLERGIKRTPRNKILKAELRPPPASPLCVPPCHIDVDAPGPGAKFWRFAHIDLTMSSMRRHQRGGK